jgi:hypothetical protein
MKKLTELCRRHRTSLWGQPHMVTPRLVDWIHGDGLQVIYLSPLATRPDYYVARIDSNLSLSNSSRNAFCDVALNRLLEAIETEFGEHVDTYEHDNGRTYTKHRPFPALDDSYGEEWGRLTMLTEPDKRSEQEIRKEISRTRGSEKR